MSTRRSRTSSRRRSRSQSRSSKVLWRRLAVQKILASELNVKVRRVPNETADVGRVYDQQPAPGERIDKGNTVVIFVSSGKPKVTVPGVIGQQATDAVAALTGRGLKAKVHRINSDKESGSVTG